MLERLRAQTQPPDVILGVDTGSTDGSAELVKAAGGQVIRWDQPYHYCKVLNFGTEHLKTGLALIISSHTTLEDDDALERMAAALEEPRVACVSAKWDEDPFYSDALGWKEIRQKCLKFCSIYSNSMACFLAVTGSPPLMKPFQPPRIMLGPWISFSWPFAPRGRLLAMPQLFQPMLRAGKSFSMA